MLKINHLGAALDPMAEFKKFTASLLHQQPGLLQPVKIK
jgi:hypothetical protein